jgi:hypothetical protein
MLFSQESIYQFFDHQLIFFIELLHSLELINKIYIGGDCILNCVKVKLLLTQVAINKR